MADATPVTKVTNASAGPGDTVTFARCPKCDVKYIVENGKPCKCRAPKKTAPKETEDE